MTLRRLSWVVFLGIWAGLLFVVFALALEAPTVVGQERVRMPDLANAIPVGVRVWTCSDLTVVLHLYDTVETVQAPYPKYVTAFLNEEPDPFLVFIDSDPFRDDSETTWYWDLDLDGFVDLIEHNNDGMTLCEAAEKVARKA